MIFIYAISRQETMSLITKYNFIGREFDLINEETVNRLYGFDKPIVVHYGCTYPSLDFEKVVHSRNGLLLPLVCGHATHS